MQGFLWIIMGSVQADFYKNSPIPPLHSRYHSSWATNVTIGIDRRELIVDVLNLANCLDTDPQSVQTSANKGNKP